MHATHACYRCTLLRHYFIHEFIYYCFWTLGGNQSLCKILDWNIRGIMLPVNCIKLVELFQRSQDKSFLRMIQVRKPETFIRRLKMVGIAKILPNS